ncbi:hypothetical protein GPECTOR_180g254 [Gonium pectorale]|uniref:PDZ domain-containing protein n=1 Tax=Gonium pectorale TaxID=33097 RepID=A0A150FXA8_GONPE|nr:hypothetical protein GPECTOR_180g254 [Gonium pectorale]|eukprot:KXZ42218.1 hypothetical protein GPECTOR_180g254 [Gonium pectorale]
MHSQPQSPYTLTAGRTSVLGASEGGPDPALAALDRPAGSELLTLAEAPAALTDPGGGAPLPPALLAFLNGLSQRLGAGLAPTAAAPPAATVAAAALTPGDLTFSLVAPSAALRAPSVAAPAPAPAAGGGAAGVGIDAELASETEDRLLEAARQVEARLEGVLGALAGGVTGMAEAGQEADRATAAAHSLIREVWEVVDGNYLDARSTGFDRQRWAQLRDAALAVPYRDTAAGYRAVRDLLARGLSDPYCRFIGPAELDAMKKYDVSGVGLNLGTANEFVVKTGNDLPAPRDPSSGEGVYVVGVSKGSPADVAGIRQGDELLAVQGESLAETTPFRAAGLISGAVEEPPSDSGGEEGRSGGGGGKEGRRKGGPAAEEVRVVVRHAGGSEEELVLVRPTRRVPSAVSTSLARSPVSLPGGGRGEELVGTVRLAAFNARAQSDVAAAIRQLEAAGASRLVLDLRDNRGGLVTEGLEVARLFLDGDAPIVVTARRDAPPDTPRAPGPALTSAPLLVLVNGHTASASEIVAGALHDNCRAVLAGSRTYGKGLIQSVYELSDGSGLVITVGKYMTPAGNDIDRYGIKPDYSSVPSAVQYDSTVAACKLAAGGALAGRTAPPVYEAADAR